MAGKEIQTDADLKDAKGWLDRARLDPRATSEDITRLANKIATYEAKGAPLIKPEEQPRPQAPPFRPNAPAQPDIPMGLGMGGGLGGVQMWPSAPPTVNDSQVRSNLTDPQAVEATLSGAASNLPVAGERALAKALGTAIPELRQAERQHPALTLAGGVAGSYLMPSPGGVATQLARGGGMLRGPLVGALAGMAQNAAVMAGRAVNDHDWSSMKNPLNHALGAAGGALGGLMRKTPIAEGVRAEQPEISALERGGSKLGWNQVVPAENMKPVLNEARAIQEAAGPYATGARPSSNVVNVSAEMLAPKIADTGAKMNLWGATEGAAKLAQAHEALGKQEVSAAPFTAAVQRVIQSKEGGILFNTKPFQSILNAAYDTVGVFPDRAAAASKLGETGAMIHDLPDGSVAVFAPKKYTAQGLESDLAVAVDKAKLALPPGATESAESQAWQELDKGLRETRDQFKLNEPGDYSKLKHELEASKEQAVARSDAASIPRKPTTWDKTQYGDAMTIPQRDTLRGKLKAVGADETSKDTAAALNEIGAAGNFLPELQVHQNLLPLGELQNKYNLRISESLGQGGPYARLTGARLPLQLKYAYPVSKALEPYHPGMMRLGGIPLRTRYDVGGSKQDQGKNNQ
jgi:hypothetical protein